MLTLESVYTVVPEGLNCPLNGDLVQPTGTACFPCLSLFPEFELDAKLLPLQIDFHDWMGLF